MSLLALLSAPASRHVVLDGDSIVSGGASNVPVGLSRTQLAALLPHCSVASVAVAGSLANVLPHAGWDTPEPSNTIAYVAVGHNDLNAGMTAAAVYAGIAAVVTELRNGGALYVVVRTVIAGTLTAPQETQRLALNVLLRADKAGAHALHDAALDSYFAAPGWGPSQASTYLEGDSTGDSVHPGTAGTLRLMTGLADVINAGLL